MSEELKTKTATEGDAVTDITIPADLQEKLAEYGADNDTMKKIVCDLGVEGLDDLTSMEVEDLAGAGMKLAKARKLLSAMKTPAKPAAATVPSAVETRAIQNQFEALLPATSLPLSPLSEQPWPIAPVSIMFLRLFPKPWRSMPMRPRNRSIPLSMLCASL